MAPKSSLSPGSPEWARELGAGVRQKRKLLGLTQAQLADLAQCGPDFLYDLERGKPSIRLDKLMPVLEVLGLRLKLEARNPAAIDVEAQ
ncbi:MAG: helix-turn-helix transcriptional regulator [Archangium sp.]|nr:helix-turn-helix transcriptional regulator [Archangium sp.]MDP3154734.1 helix-turn-helix transcriptional regulator [Archangium sp.]MDP3573624.1 helix-turn-helix transcriptional regulator [Archangium sp.]